MALKHGELQNKTQINFKHLSTSAYLTSRKSDGQNKSGTQNCGTRPTNNLFMRKSRKESGDGSGTLYGNLSLTSPDRPSSGTRREIEKWGVLAIPGEEAQTKMPGCPGSS